MSQLKLPRPSFADKPVLHLGALETDEKAGHFLTEKGFKVVSWPLYETEAVQKLS